jgi:HK97 gp10 family phage protein
MHATLTGTPALHAKLKKIEGALTAQALANATLAGALVIEGSAKEKVHVITGNLRRSLHSAIETSSATSATAIVGTDVEYSVYEEFGTRYRPPHPYLRPALDEKKGEAQKVIRDAFAALIEQAAR